MLPPEYRRETLGIPVEYKKRATAGDAHPLVRKSSKPCFLRADWSVSEVRGGFAQESVVRPDISYVELRTIVHACALQFLDDNICVCYQGVALPNHYLDSVFWGAPEASPLENAFSGSPNRVLRIESCGLGLVWRMAQG